MRVIRGRLKRKSLKVPPNIRPTFFRIKKAIFDLLDQELTDKIVLDLFAGAGSLGIEALSCGAREVVFVDIKKGCVKTIIANLSLLKLTANTCVYLKDASKAIKDFYKKRKKFDIVFLDPPYYGSMIKKALQTLSEYDILTPSGYIVVLCYHKEDFKRINLPFLPIFTRRYGQSLLLIYKKK